MRRCAFHAILIGILAFSLHANRVLASSISINAAYGLTGNGFAGTTLTNLTFDPDATVVNDFGGNYNTSEYKQSPNAFTMSIKDHTRTGVQNSYVESSQVVAFTANANAHYDFFGSYSYTTPSVLLAGLLYDLADGYQFYTASYTNNNYSSAPGTLTIGENNGQINSVFGQLSGDLILNHHYVFASYALSQAYFNADHGATASGFTTLAFSSASSGVAPLPSTSAIGIAIFGGLGIVQVIRRKKLLAV